ncbi:flagellar hook-basal body complex protein [Planktomarina temperata]|nr:flagellar hook-basal body complex protein [Planktomarina temperata]
MSFYTALTGLNGAQAEIASTSNNIANVGTTGFKRSRAEFGDIFATSPLQNASSSIGSGTILKGVKQQFTQGNIASSLNALDLAVSGQGFFALKPSLTSTQTVYTRNGSFNVDNDRYVVDSAGQYLMTYPVNLDGSVTAKDLDSAVPLQLPVTSGEPKATGKIDLGVNVPADAPVVTQLSQFEDGYSFDANDPNTYTNSTSITIFDDLGNPTIATIYFIKTQNASGDDPTNKYDTRLVINDTIIEPDLVKAVDDTEKQLFIDRFGNQTTAVPDDNYFLEGKGSPLYKLDDLKQQVSSQPATLRGEQSAFDFGEEGDKLVEIVTDPLLFKATREGGKGDSDIFWGKDFLTVNVDDSDAPVSIDVRPGLYNAEQLAAEVERAINEAYGDDKKIQVYQNIDDRMTIDLFKLGADGSLSGLQNKIEIDILQNTSVSELMNLDVEGASPDFSREEFLSHTQTRINDELNDYIYDSDGTLGSGASALGVEGRLFTRTIGAEMSSIYTSPEVIEVTHKEEGISPDNKRFLSYSYFGDRPTLSVYDKKLSLEGVTDGVLDASGKAVVYDNTQNTLTINVPTDFGIPASSAIRLVGPITNATGDFETHLNGRELRVFENSLIDPKTTVNALLATTSTFAASDHTLTVSADATKFTIEIGGKTQTLDISGQNFATADTFVTWANTQITSGEVTGLVKARLVDGKVAFEQDTGSDAAHTSLVLSTVGATVQTLLGLSGATVTGAEGTTEIEINDGADYRTLRIDTSGLNLPESRFELPETNLSILFETSQNLEAFVEGAINPVEGAYETFNSKRIVVREIGSSAQRSTSQTTTAAASGISFGDTLIGTSAAKTALGLASASVSSKISWVDENNPPIKMTYDELEQRFQFTVDRTVLGTGTGSNFNAFSVYGAADAESTNGLGIPSSGAAEQVLIRGGEILSTESFIADGEEVRLNDKRYGINVQYNGDTKSFTVASGSTGETINANGALGVDEDQKSSNIQIGRRIISTDGGGAADQSEVIDLDSRIIGGGDNALFGFGATKQDFSFQEGRGLAAAPAISTGRAAQGDLTEVFRLTSSNNENRFNVSVNGIAGIIDIPAGNYVGTTLAAALEERINQITSPLTGEAVGGVTVRFSATDNNFTFTTGTTGETSTIKVKGAARLGLDDVPLGVGSVPKIFNLVQATNSDGIALYVDAQGDVVTTPPESMVDGYYPLYIDEGELTFDKTGKLVSPKNNVRYEQQAEGFSISLDIDYSLSSQFAQPFSVLSVEQDGFTSGRLDGLEIDSSGTIRANYTNGQNNPLGKIVVANFNNQNGLKQIGNATYVETAVSGTPQVGEAGAEGFGNILSGSLERSNVDITEELVNLITAQRNYQASAKAIETTTSLTQTIINIRM